MKLFLLSPFSTPLEWDIWMITFQYRLEVDVGSFKEWILSGFRDANGMQWDEQPSSSGCWFWVLSI